MDTIKWLRRKFPVSHKEIEKVFDLTHLEMIKKDKFRIGRLTADHQDQELYVKGTIFMYRNQKVYDDDGGWYPQTVWTGEYQKYYVFKCIDPKLTQSGYISATAYHLDFEEITPYSPKLSPSYYEDLRAEKLIDQYVSYGIHRDKIFVRPKTWDKNDYKSMYTISLATQHGPIRDPHIINKMCKGIVVTDNTKEGYLRYAKIR